MAPHDRIGIDAPRFWRTVMRSGEIGPGKAGGRRRLALSDADTEMRDHFKNSSRTAT
jgi:N-carbamoyl-L-amino-acid hydrolase